MEMLFQRRRVGGALSIASEYAVVESPGYIEGDTAAVFANWWKQDCSLALWRRDIGGSIAAAFDALDLDALAGFRITTYAEASPRRIFEAVGDLGLRSAELADFLAADFARLVRHFAAATGSQQLDIRLEVVRDDACSRFHVDNMPARLVVTYVGPGTVFVPRSHGEAALAGQQSYDGPIMEMKRFAAGLFAGATGGKPGLVHRSPRISATAETRLFFCVNRSAH